MARERLVGSSLRCGPVSFVLFFCWLVMSDVQGGEEMARYWYREKKDWGWAGVYTNNRDERNDELFGK